MKMRGGGGGVLYGGGVVKCINENGVCFGFIAFIAVFMKKVLRRGLKNGSKNNYIPFFRKSTNGLNSKATWTEY